MEQTESKNKKLVVVIAAVVAALVALGIILMVVFKGGKANLANLVGTWRQQGEAYIYEFKSNGTGSWREEDVEPAQNFTYNVTTQSDSNGKNKDVIEFKFENSDKSLYLPYRLDNGKLIIADSFGKEIVYDKE